MPCFYRHPSGGGCQFPDNGITTPFAGSHYCQWHLPADAKAQWDKAHVAAFHAKIGKHVASLQATGAPIDLAGVAIAGDCDFDQESLRHASFHGATFTGRVSFDGTTFIEPADFTSTTFLRNASFGSAKFQDTALFNLSDFRETAIFAAVSFAALASFESIYLRGFANFEAANFAEDANFRSASLSGESTFRGAHFDSADFRAATFSMDASFDRASFATTANFRGANFIEAANFSATAFGEAATFDEVLFRSAAVFSHATFKVGAYFRSAQLPSGAYFDNVHFGGDAELPTALDEAAASIRVSSWQGAVFLRSANFENRVFKGEGDFGGAIFTEAPRFHGCKLHQAMIFPSENHFKDVDSPDAAQAYRTLKLAMAAMKSRAEEGMFFTLEQRSLRNASIGEYSGRFYTWRRHPWRGFLKLADSKNTRTRPPMNVHEIILSWMYDAASEFGRNAFRPACLVVLIWALFMLAYAVIKGPALDVTAPLDWHLLKHLAAFSLEQVLRPLYVWGSNSDTLFVSPVPLRIKLLASLQSLLSFALISLSLLALNWRFKRD